MVGLVSSESERFRLPRDDHEALGKVLGALRESEGRECAHTRQIRGVIAGLISVAISVAGAGLTAWRSIGLNTVRIEQLQKVVERLDHKSDDRYTRADHRQHETTIDARFERERLERERLQTLLTGQLAERLSELHSEVRAVRQMLMDKRTHDK